MFECFPLQCLFPHGGAGRGHAVLPAEVWAAGQDTVRPPGQRQQADRQLRAEVRGEQHDGVLTLCCVQVLGPGGQVPAAAAGPALVIQTRPADVWIQPSAVPTQS